MRGLFPYRRFRFSEPAGEAVEVDVWIEWFNLTHYRSGAIFNDGKVVNDHLNYTDHFLDVMPLTHCYTLLPTGHTKGRPPKTSQGRRVNIQHLVS